jgi:ribonuclease P protein component
MNALCASRSNDNVSTTLTLSKEKRILRSAEFRKVYQAGVRVTFRHFAAFCHAAPGSGSPSRYGFTLPRAIGTAVARNRIRRRFREAVRAHLAQLPEDWAIVFNPRRSALDVPFNELSGDVSRLFERCKKL